MADTKKQKMYNTMLDVAFTVVTPYENYEDIPPETIIAALLNRVAYLAANRQELTEAIGFSDQYEIKDTHAEAQEEV